MKWRMGIAMSRDRRDTRKSQRYFYVTPLRYTGEGKYENLDALSINISEDGLYFQSDHDLPVGHEFVLTFKIPGNTDILEAKCEVIHHTELPDGSGYSIGCRINDIEGMGKEEMKKKLYEAFGEDPDRLY
jgi:hypothetical protein